MLFRTALVATLFLQACVGDVDPLPAKPGSSCPSLSTEALRYEHPVSGDSVYVVSASDVSAAIASGYSRARGTAFIASLQPEEGFVQVTRLFDATALDHVFTIDPALKRRLLSEGYVEEPATPFYVPATALDCTAPVISLVETARRKHRLTTSAEERAALLALNWQDEGVVFHARAGTSSAEADDAGTLAEVDAGQAPDAGPQDAGALDAGTPDAGPPDAGPRDAGGVDSGTVDTVFTLVVMPDTQREVNTAAKAPRFANRMDWVKTNRQALDIRYVLQVGDLNDWDTTDHIMYERTSAGLSILDDAGIPWVAVPGNHDTNAVGIGGSACTPTGTPSCPTVPQALRITNTFNQYYPTTRFPNLAGTFEANKVDNAFHLFSAGGVDFLILALELWPRTAVVDWAKGVVSGHPHHNVIIVTHSYLDSSGNIETSNGGYGANSPKYLFDNLIKPNANVRLVLSGHVGTHGFRKDTNAAGGTVYAFNQCYHDEVTNPSRLLELDVANGTIKSRVYAPWDDTTKNDGSTFTVTGVQFVR